MSAPVTSREKSRSKQKLAYVPHPEAVVRHAVGVYGHMREDELASVASSVDEDLRRLMEDGSTPPEQVYITQFEQSALKIAKSRRVLFDWQSERIGQLNAKKGSEMSNAVETRNTRKSSASSLKEGLRKGASLLLTGLPIYAVGRAAQGMDWIPSDDWLPLGIAAPAVAVTWFYIDRYGVALSEKINTDFRREADTITKNYNKSADEIRSKVDEGLRRTYEKETEFLSKEYKRLFDDDIPNHDTGSTNGYHGVIKRSPFNRLQDSSEQL